MNKQSNKKNENKSKEKLAYVSPEIKILYVELEHSIAAGSAKISPKDSNDEVFERWEVDADDERIIEW